MEGYAKLALLMGRHSEFAMFRRFRALNMQNLLYLQAELTDLEDQLQKLVCRDSEDPNRNFYTKDWWSLSQSEVYEEREQWEKFLDIRVKLKEYSESIRKRKLPDGLTADTSFQTILFPRRLICPEPRGRHLMTLSFSAAGW